MNSRTGLDRRDFLAGRAPLARWRSRNACFAGRARRRTSRRARSTGSSIRRPAARSIPPRASSSPISRRPGVKTTLDYVLGAGGRVARTKLVHRQARRLHDDDGVSARRRHRRDHRAREIQGELDFTPIYGWSVIGWQICVKKDSPIRTFKDLVEECKKRRVVIGTIGRGASSHIQLAAIQKDLDLQFGMAHFEGSGKAYPAVLGGHVDAAISGPGSGSRMRGQPAFPRRHRRASRTGAARRADVEGAGLQCHADRPDLVRDGHAEGAERPHRRR